MLWDFLDEKMTMPSVCAFLSAVYSDANIEVSTARNVANLLLVHNDTDYAFSSDDLSWLGFFGDAYMCETDFGYDVLCIETKSSSVDYYTACAALIKLFSKAFSRDLLFLFRFDSSIAFGCKRESHGTAEGNFCVTQQFDLTCESLARDFLLALTLVDVEDVPWLIIKYSPQERNEAVDKHDRMKLNTDYLRFLEEFSGIYGVDTTGEHERYIHTFEEAPVNKVAYQAAKDILSGVADEKFFSSYEILDEAVEAEEKYMSMQAKYLNDESVDDQLPDRTEEFSKEAFLKADVMLDEMLKGH